jgi:hypothetical protein
MSMLMALTWGLCLAGCSSTTGGGDGDDDKDDGPQADAGPCSPATCTDDDPCTASACEFGGGCVHTPINASGSQTFDATGSIETFTVPACVERLSLSVAGAQGGAAGAAPGGLGAQVTGELTVSPAETFSLLVGAQGVAALDADQQSGGTGGGGSFVVDAAGNPVMVAGGGGGATSQSGFVLPGGPGLADSAGGSGMGDANMPGGTEGSAGQSSNWTGYHGGTGGGGFSGSAAASTGNGDYGAPNGGGGAAGFTGGGGGGYSGGGAGHCAFTGGFPPDILMGSGGGGGSFNAAETATASEGVQAGNGQITITW